MAQARVFVVDGARTPYLKARRRTRRFQCRRSGGGGGAPAAGAPCRSRRPLSTR
ncbi:MAG: hypothetical protein MZV65_35530 [Chromatiales bacterium]|nr:hypothetical protein [Chromatiales bacterium]